jgi:lambda family phage portal protein
MSKHSKKAAKAAKVAAKSSALNAVALAPAPSHDAAGTGRRMRGWMPSSSGPNRAITGAPAIRHRARDASRNDWAARAIVNRWAASLIGTGIMARPKTKDEALKTRLVELWDDWSEVCDADGALDFYGIQYQATRNWIESGEVFIRLRPRYSGDGLPVPLQLQVLEADLVPPTDGTAPNGNEICQGIEFNAYGQRVAYWMYRNHPGDGRGDTGTLSRVEAQFILHIYEPDRPGQLRGISKLAPILAKLRNVGDFDDAVLERQKIANLFTGFLEKAPSTGDATIDPLTGLAINADHDGVPMAAMEPGTMQELLPGESVKFSEPPDAGAGYGDFTRVQYQGIAAGVGLPYELLTGDLRDVSDRALRIIFSEHRRDCSSIQWRILIPQICRKVRAAWADAALFDGTLSGEECAEAKRVNWVPQGWAYIHPTQDVQAKQMEVDAGFNSRSRIITERGDDPAEIDQERAEDQARADALGLTPAIVAPEQDPEAQQREQEKQLQARILQMLEDDRE